MSLTMCSLSLDDDLDWPAQDGAPPALGARGTKNWPLQRVWRGCAHPAHGGLCARCPLAGLHLVRHWVCGAVGAEGAHRLAGQPRQRHRPALHGQQHRGAVHKGEVSCSRYPPPPTHPSPHTDSGIEEGQIQREKVKVIPAGWGDARECRTNHLAARMIWRMLRVWLFGVVWISHFFQTTRYLFILLLKSSWCKLARTAS